jgi:hypothetical protein
MYTKHARTHTHTHTIHQGVTVEVEAGWGHQQAADVRSGEGGGVGGGRGGEGGGVGGGGERERGARCHPQNVRAQGNGKTLYQAC